MQDNGFIGPELEFLTRPDDHMLQLGSALAELRSQVSRAGALVPEQLLGTVDDLATALDGFSAPITFVGQVKAGKTTLVNVLAGQPGLLPADVNPWTSVVTTLHLNGKRPRNVRAEFRFFDREEWDRLIEEGGRLGRMAQRAGAEAEFEEIRAKVQEMRERSRQRLGDKFELMMGNRHSYDQITPALIERYVCLGDEDAVSAPQGRFADITRSADLYLDLPSCPLPLELRDTPGVNDPLLVREQITLRSIGDSALCVVVLSAAQALSTVDLALIQLLAAMEGRQVILFVNRIDELDRPKAQIEEIRQSLEQVLSRNGITEVAGILFGSARWAELVMTGALDRMPERAKEALADLVGPGMDGDPAPELVWQLSGLPALQASIGARLAGGAGRRLLEGTRRQLANAVTGALAREATCTGLVRSALDAEATELRLSRLYEAAQDCVRTDLAACIERLEERARQGCDEFIAATVEGLMEQTARNGAVAQGNCDPMQLRVRLRAAYGRFGVDARGLFGSIGQGLCEALNDLIVQMLGDAGRSLTMEPPQPPLAPPPVALGGTIAVDLNSSWLRGWLAPRLGRSSLRRDYERLVRAEIDAIRVEVTGMARSNADAMARVLADFLDEQSALLMSLARGDLAEDVAAQLPGLGRNAGLRLLDTQLRAELAQQAPAGDGDPGSGEAPAEAPGFEDPVLTGALMELRHVV